MAAESFDDLGAEPDEHEHAARVLASRHQLALGRAVMRLIHRLVYRLGIRPRMGSVLYSPTLAWDAAARDMYMGIVAGLSAGIAIVREAVPAPMFAASLQLARDLESTTAAERISALTKESTMSTPETADKATALQILNRASASHPVADDPHAGLSTAVRNALDTDPDTRERWLASLTIEDAETVVNELIRVTDEHRRRAEASDVLQSAVRTRLQDAVQFGLPQPATVRG